MQFQCPCSCNFNCSWPWSCPRVQLCVCVMCVCLCDVCVCVMYVCVMCVMWCMHLLYELVVVSYMMVYYVMHVSWSFSMGKMVTIKILLVECFLAAPCCDDHTVLAIMLMPICIISVQVWYTSLMCSTLAVKNLTWAWALRTSWPVHVPIIRQMVYMGTCSNKLKKRTKSRRDINILELIFLKFYIYSFCQLYEWTSFMSKTKFTLSP